MSVAIKTECPKCHADRTMLDTSFGLPGYIDPRDNNEQGASLNPTCAVPVRLILCPRCHYLELYHDVGLGNLA